MAELPLDKILSSDKIDQTKKIGMPEQKVGNEELFRMYMDQAAGLIGQGPAAEGVETPLLSPFELAPPSTPLAAGPSFETLISQVGSTQASYNDLRNLSQTPGLHLRQSESMLVNTKLEGARANVRTAAEKIEANLSPLSQPPASLGPLEKFLMFIGDGERQLANTQAKLREIQEKGESVNPADFLLLQIKLNKAQQEIEFSSMVMSKAVEGIKSIMATQI